MVTISEARDDGDVGHIVNRGDGQIQDLFQKYN